MAYTRRRYKYGYSRYKRKYRRKYFGYSKRKSYKSAKRYKRRFPKTRECKYIECGGSKSIGFQKGSGQTANSYVYYPAWYIPIGLIQPHQGTGNHERVGSKIKPVKLRFWGAFSYGKPLLVGESDITAQIGTDNYTSHEELQNPLNAAFGIRFICYQVKSGRGNLGSSLDFLLESDGEPLPSSKYHRLAPIWVINDGNTQLEEIKKTYPYFVSNILTDFTVKQYNDYTPDDFVKNFGCMNYPLRMGIGGTFKMLYEKKFYISATRPENDSRPINFFI